MPTKRGACENAGGEPASSARARRTPSRCTISSSPESSRRRPRHEDPRLRSARVGYAVVSTSRELADRLRVAADLSEPQSELSVILREVADGITVQDPS